LVQFQEKAASFKAAFSIAKDLAQTQTNSSKEGLFDTVEV